MFLEADMRGEPGLRELADVLQHAVDVDGGARDRLFAERLHPVDQVADAIGFVADQDGEFAVGRGNTRFQKLRRAADAGQRVLHLMRQNGGHAGHAARGAAEGELTVQVARGGGVLNDQQDSAGFFGQRRALDGDAALVQAGTFEIEIVVGNGGLGAADLLDQQEQGVIGRQQVGHPKLFQAGGGNAEELFGLVIDVPEPAFGVQQDHRHGHGTEDRGGVHRPVCRIRGGATAPRQQAGGLGDDVAHAATSRSWPSWPLVVWPRAMRGS